MSGLGQEETSASPNKDELGEIARSQDEQKRMQDKQREKERRRSLERKKELEREKERKIREEAAKAQEEDLKGVKRKAPEKSEAELLDQNNAPSAKRPAVASPGGETSGLFCQVKDAKCTEQGKIFSSAYNLRYHYAKHAKAALTNRLKQSWPNFMNSTNTCDSCQIIFQSRDILAFHIGAKHREVDAILTRKGIPVPEEEETLTQTKIREADKDNVASSSGPVVEATSAPPPSPTIESPASESNQTNKNQARKENESSNETQKSQSQMEVVSGEVVSREEKVVTKEVEVNYELQCQVCEASCSTLSQLHQHCTNHFIRNIQTKFNQLIAEGGKECLVCGFTAKSRTQVVTHLGCKHGKVNDVLQEMGFKTLPCPVAPNTHKDQEIQRKLVELKKERQLQSLSDIVEEEELVEEVDNNHLLSTHKPPESLINVREDIFDQNSPKTNQRKVSFGPDEIFFVPSIKRY